ncbi:hypothetical protein SCP_1400640 [Sparassis crispa]|uniref:Uncharacterized protein n=1 Tax=Sparassis crispa TaxID=139825 RepID=A0A401H2N9_9APHY|nr:hypothetical protein SCP_1400640 [Sparassis crispa]GBE88659.1 hypothetical protein SCP_1400640 [Sparassis crispa]
MDSLTESSTTAFEYSVHTLTQTSRPEVKKVLRLLFHIPKGVSDRKPGLQRAPLDYAELILYELDQWLLPTDGQQILDMLHDLEYTLAEKLLQSARTLCTEEATKNSLGQSMDVIASDFDFMIETARILRDFTQFTAILISSYLSDDQTQTSRKARVESSRVCSKPRMSKYVQRILTPDDYTGYQEFSHFLPQDPGENGVTSRIEYTGMEGEDEFGTGEGKIIIKVKGGRWLRAYCGHRCECNEPE